MPQLETRKMGRTGMTPKSLGLGGAWWQAVSEQENIAGIHRAIELGINYLDTYPGEYTPDTFPGQNEARWGKALAGGKREQVYLQAKVSSNAPGERHTDHSGPQTRRSVEASLKLLRTDYLDSVLIHGYDELSDVQTLDDFKDPLAPGNALDELLKMKEAGLIRHIGIGARSAAVQRRAIETGQIEILLTYLDYGLLSQSVGTTTFALAQEYGVGLILASPLAMGLLTGVPEAFERAASYSDNETTAALARSMWDWCLERDLNIRHLAIQFCLGAPIDGIVMPGPCTLQQVEEAYEAATADIPDQVWKDFEAEFGIGI
jgi:D-threo-aldose 1-dehydrogenase